MRPLTDLCPKPLLPVGGKPLIVWHVERLAQAGIGPLVINLSHLGDQISAALGDGSRWGLTIRYACEDRALETGGGIFNALELLGDGPFLVANADVWADLNALPLAMDDAALAHLVLVDNPIHNPGGDFVLDHGMIRNRGGPRLTFAGIGVYRAALFEDCRGGAFPLAPVLRSAADRGRVTGAHYRGAWTDVGTPERLQALDAMLSGGAAEI